ncbi:MAG: zinc-binding dehydrogenase [Acidimicrobiales bacterium]|jgi:threonine dehydrogenase-like Zn-dependent dehydrogenase|nr:zinc-binding dehydrogenase [Actinomycetes bacterium]MDG1989632.1 zinc-binding dehydrogenase [Acidimicrobiales bacterium]MDP6286750.1 zinc-binding dehydrogenase [Acidimicrobiales bacterium]MDP6910810.1 zinc-binding dehydrogenase [Acidimicrobiales bacterium]HCW01560.1 zinc-binding alcohol dehydrogenase [Acidimicrobiaceae bacterium]
MKALQFRRNLPRYAAARVAGSITPGRGASAGPLKLVDLDTSRTPGPDWVRVRPRLSGICGSDLATVDGRSARYFEPLVSFPFVPGHEVVGDLDNGSRVVLEPVLGCVSRNLDPTCTPCAEGHLGNCEHTSFGDLGPGIQIGSCHDTGGGWSTAFNAHPSQLHPVPETLDDEAAVMVEPTACGVHAALMAEVPEGGVVAVLGAGTLGLVTLAALRAHATPGTVVATARYPEQRRQAAALGADQVVAPDEIRRAVRRITGSRAIGAPGLGETPTEGLVDRLTGGADVVIDCVGSSSSLTDALAIVRPRGRIVLVGMPAEVSLELTPLWHREITLVGAYTYGTETLPDGTERRTFDLAADLVGAASLGSLVSATYPLARYRDALEHAASAGRRGATKIAFDLRDEKERLL